MLRFAASLILLLPTLVHAQAKLQPKDVPQFQVRARVTSHGGAAPDKAKFAFRFGVPSEGIKSAGGDWSEWMTFGDKQIEATLKGYPALYMRSWPIVVRLSVSPISDPTIVEAELKFAGSDEAIPLKGELFGPNLGILIWKEGDTPKAATMAQYNHRYWKHLAETSIPEKDRPKKFNIVDRFIGGDDDRIAWREGIDHLSKAGFSVLMLPPSKNIRELLLKTGLRKTSWAVYNPPGYAFAFDPKITPESIDAWAQQQAKPYLDAGYAKEDMAVFAMSDEPGWYFPKQFEDLTKHPEALVRFRKYLEQRGLTPNDVGAETWQQVMPLGRTGAQTPQGRRLFYWTMRFFATDSAQHFAASTKALEKAFYPGLPVLTNWNFFAGRLYVPGPVANNPDKKSPDAAMGGHDWLEFGRLRGGTLLWTEDWFGDDRAYQWSFYASKLRSAAKLGGVEFGGYVVPRSAGDRDDGILQRILAIAGHGGKTIKYFVFGPEYNFPGNCYSERARLLPKMAEAHRMIGQAEDLLWEGRTPNPQVGILLPRSSQMWDAKDQKIASGISDATNGNMNGSTVDYMAEVFNLYLALQHANVPVEFVDEDNLTPTKLRELKVLYVTEPNVPIEGQKGLLAWVQEGGTLVTVSGAARKDRYDEPSDGLMKELGIREAPRERMLVPNTMSLKVTAIGKGAIGPFEAVGIRGKMDADVDDTFAAFDDGASAIVRRGVGKGQAWHFAWMPGLSYWKSQKGKADKLPVGFSESIRNYILAPVRAARVVPPVETDRAFVEAPMLVSKQGAAVTLLNWTGETVNDLGIVLRTPFPPRQIESVRLGKLEFVPENNGARLKMKLEAADILKITP